MDEDELGSYSFIPQWNDTSGFSEASLYSLSTVNGLIKKQQQKNTTIVHSHVIQFLWESSKQILRTSGIYKPTQRKILSVGRGLGQ